MSLAIPTLNYKTINKPSLPDRPADRLFSGSSRCVKAWCSEGVPLVRLEPRVEHLLRAVSQRGDGAKRTYILQATSPPPTRAERGPDEGRDSSRSKAQKYPQSLNRFCFDPNADGGIASRSRTKPMAATTGQIQGKM
jgi:hypothetical protein